MLNEFKAIADKIEEMGICEESLHPYISIAPKGGNKIPKFKVLIGEKGKVDSVEIVDQEVWSGDKGKGFSGFYYIFENASNQYPIVKLSNLWDVKKEDCESFLRQDSFPKISEKKLWEKDGVIKGGMMKWDRIEQKLLDILERNNKTEGIFILAERLSHFKTVDDFNLFFRDIFEKILSLFPLEPSKKGDIVKKDILNSIYISLDISGGIGMNINPITHIDTMKIISDAYKKIDSDQIVENTDKLDIFGNGFTEFVTLPQLSLNGSKFYPYSRNKNTPCHSTYSVNGYSACELSPISKKHIIEKMQYLLNSGHKGTYWNMSNNKDGTKDVFIAFAPVDKTDMVDFQNSIIGFGEEIDSLSADFSVKEESKKIFGNLRASEYYKNNDQAHLILFRSPSNGPSRIVMSETITVPSLVSYAEKWVDGWKNYKSSVISIKKGEYKNLSSTLTLQGMKKIVNKRWSRKANLGSEFDFVYTNDMLNLFMGGKEELNKVTKILSSNHIYLLIDLVNRIHNHLKYELFSNSRKDVFKLPIVFGEILHYHGINKENYEQMLPYVLGKLTALVSKIQREYLISQGRDKMPSRLIGTKYIHNMLTNSLVSINLLLEDAKYYLTRVKLKRKIDFKINKKSSKFYNYYQFSKALEVVKNSDLNQKWSNLDRMLIALGYFQNR